VTLHLRPLPCSQLPWGALARWEVLMATPENWPYAVGLDMAASTEDPTPYTMELISREQLLGPSHPEVPLSVPYIAMPPTVLIL